MSELPKGMDALAWYDPAESPPGGIPRGWESVGYLADPAQTAFHRSAKPEPHNYGLAQRKEPHPLDAVAQVRWRTARPATLVELRKVLDEDLQRIAEITKVPPTLLAPFDDSERRILDSRERDMQQVIDAVRRRMAVSPHGLVPGDDGISFTTHTVPTITTPTKQKDTTMSHELPNGGILFAKLTISGESAQGTLTAYETLLDAARRIGVDNETDITLDEDNDPTIEVSEDEVDLHALADLLQPREKVSDNAPPTEPEPPEKVNVRGSTLGSVEWNGIRVPAIRYSDNAVSYCTPDGRWRAAFTMDQIAQSFVGGVTFDPSDKAF